MRLRESSFILVYHRIENYQGGLHSLYTSPSFFDWQMRYLYRQGYQGVSLAELGAAIRQGQDIGRKFAITFDDGYEDNFFNAYPVLKKYNFRATVFVHTAAVGKSFSYPRMPAAPLMDWEQLRQLSQEWEIGSHTVTHQNLARESNAVIEQELKESKEILEKNLAISVKSFSYPFGEVFAGYREMLTRYGYENAVSLKPGLVRTSEQDFLALPRLEWKSIWHSSFRNHWKNRLLYRKIFLGY